jgi:hypothetical protein
MGKTPEKVDFGLDRVCHIKNAHNKPFLLLYHGGSTKTMGAPGTEKRTAPHL